MHNARTIKILFQMVFVGIDFFFISFILLLAVLTFCCYFQLNRLLMKLLLHLCTGDFGICYSDKQIISKCHISLRWLCLRNVLLYHRQWLWFDNELSTHPEQNIQMESLLFCICFCAKSMITNGELSHP